ncbi:MAG: glutamine synthetase III [Oscillospiraceae bacterium]|nr:glutamine synthetase III [Oscillospiraceae bacterium]
MFDFNTEFGSKLFNDTVMKQRLRPEIYDAVCKIRDEGMAWDPAVADEVAEAMKNWAMELGATHYVHWFSPLTGTNSGRHDSFLDGSDKNGKPIIKFSGKLLSKGESDASSFPSGGLRSTFEARGYTVWDVTSPCYVQGTTLYIPTAFAAFTGEALDQKTPLLRSTQAVNKQVTKVMNLLGFDDIKSVKPTVGAEQEYFLVDKEYYSKRLDIKITGRTIFGAKPPKGQEMCNHYYGSTKDRVRDYMRDVDRQLWELGVPSKTEHNEAAPGQFEMACVYTDANIACDHNQIVMNILRKTSVKHNLACLLHEKPFVGINGSGKHNNYSLATNTGENLLSPGANPEENIKFLITLAAFIKGVDEHADLLRLSAAVSGNDYRLGAHEAPPAIISIYLGDYLQSVLEKISLGQNAHIEEHHKQMNLGAKVLSSFELDENDRNRTSPFAFTGSKFEFRMVGSSQPIGFVNTVINAMVAVSMKEFAAQLATADDKIAKAYEIVGDVYKKHSRVIFNGNGYSDEWVKEAEKRGLPNIRSTVDAIPVMIKPENIEFFAKAHTYSEAECYSRYEILLENYVKTITVELNTALEMVNRLYLPAGAKYLGKLAKGNYFAMQTGYMSQASSRHQQQIAKMVDEIADCTQKLTQNFEAALREKEITDKAKALYCALRDDLGALRKSVDNLETFMPKEEWPTPSYTDLLFYL